MTVVLRDKMADAILMIVSNNHEPLETEEIISRLHESAKYGHNMILKSATRTRVMYRLHNLRADGLIFGKMLGAGKGVWIWWNKK